MATQTRGVVAFGFCGAQMCIRHEDLGREGLHTLYRWYARFEQEHFPDPHGLRQLLQRCTLGLYPNVIKVSRCRGCKALAWHRLAPHACTCVASAARVRSSEEDRACMGG